MTQTQFLKFDGVSRPVAVVDGQRLVDCLGSVFISWPFEVLPPGDVQGLPVITVRGGDDGFRFNALRPEKHPHEIDAACSMVVDLIAAHVEEHPQQLCFHAGAVEFHGQLVVFPNRYRAGKSLLCAALAARGHRVFADDILRAETTAADGVIRGLATGVAPRLRLPLPETLDQTTQTFITQQAGPGSKRFVYLDLDETRLAPYNTKRSIGAFVLLDREEGCVAALEKVAPNDMLHRVVWQNFARGTQADRILELLHGLVAGAAAFRLRYDDLDDGVRMLTDALGAEHMTAVQRPPTIEPLVPQARQPTHFRPDPNSNYHQWARGIKEHVVHGDSFLTDNTGRSIHHLNTTGSMIWRLHAEPIAAAEVIDLMHAAFPEEDPASLAQDVQRIVETLVRKKLVRAVDPAVMDDVSLETGDDRERIRNPGPR